MTSEPFDRRLLIGALGAWVAIAIATLALEVPLGHDEAAVAVLARGDDLPGWIYRSRGLVVLARLGIVAGGAEWELRLPCALINAGVVVAVFAVARAASGATVGAWAAAVIAGAHWMVLRSTELLGDLPATACCLGALAIVVGELDRERPRWRLVLAAPLFAAAFYVRYGSAPVIAVAGGAALVLWWRSILRRPGPAIAAIALFAVLLVPHVLDSIRSTGRALGILEISRATPPRAYVGEGLVRYLTANPFRFYGALVAPLALAGLLGIVRTRRRASWYLWLVAVATLVAIGLQTHAQPRYVFIATSLLVVLGVDAVRAVAPRALVWRRIALGLVVAAWLGAAIAVVPMQRALAAARAPYLAAAATMRLDAASAPCRIVARREQQIAWYSGCAPASFVDPTVDDTQYVAWLPDSAIEVSTAAPPSMHLVPLATTPPARVWRADR